MLEILSWGIPFPVALSLVALIGYFVGMQRRKQVDTSRAQADINRAQTVIKDLEAISQQVRLGLATHHANVLQFKERLTELGQQDPQLCTQELFAEADKILQPTLQLASQIAQAYNEIRLQTETMAAQAAVEPDPLAKLGDHAAMDQTLKTLFALHSRYGNKFAVAIFDIDHFQAWNEAHGRPQGDELLRQIALLLSTSVRETDLVVRYGGEEFVLVLPETDLVGCCILAERMRLKIEKQMDVTVSVGVAMVLDTDSAKTLLSRADSALYSAKTSGRNRVFQHTGRQIVASTMAEMQAQLVATGRAAPRATSNPSEAETVTLKFPRTGTR